MAIRSAAKALIVDGGRILLNRCRKEGGGVYYDLPGGGQNPYESLEDALKREVLEESGYRVKAERFLALAEVISPDVEARRTHPDYTHRVLHIFLARLESRAPETPTELDAQTDELVWLPLDEADQSEEIFPQSLRHNIRAVLESRAPAFLGTEYHS